MLLRFLLLLPLFFAGTVRAQNYVADAYLVRNGGDTLRGQVLLPRGFTFGNDQSFVDVFWVTSDSTQDHYPADSVLALGVRKRRLEAHYRRLQLPGERRPHLAKLQHPGPKLTSFYGTDEQMRVSGMSVGATASGMPIPMPMLSSVEVAYVVLQDPAGHLLPLYRTSWNAGRRKLLSFLRYDPTLAALADRMVKDWADLPEFLKAANQ